MRNFLSLTLAILTVVVLCTAQTPVPTVAPIGEELQPAREVEENIPMGLTTPVPDACSTEQFEQCMLPMMNKGNFSLGGPVTWTAELLKKQCSDFKIVETCVEGIVGDCSGPESYQWSALSSIMSFLCNEAFNETLKYATCSGTGQAKTDLQMCLQALTKDQAAMLHSEQEDKEAQCGILEQYEECVVEVEGEDCGEGARELYVKIFSKLNTVLDTASLCSGGNDDEEQIDAMEDSGEEEEPEEVVDEERCEIGIAECLQPLEPHRTAFTQFRVETIPQICSDFSTVDKCMEEMASSCKETMEWKIIENAFEQICEPDTFEGITNATNCIGREDVVTKLQSCEREELIEDVKVSDEKTCQVLEEYVDCYSVTVERECEVKAGELISQVMTGVAQVIQLDKEVSCEETDDEDEEDVDGDDEDNDEVNEDELDDDKNVLETNVWGELKECLGPLADMHTSNLPVNKFESLDQLCLQAEKAKACAEDMAEDLDDEKRNNLERLMTAVDYVCEEEREEFNEVYDCMSTTFDSTNNMESCYERRSDDGTGSENVCRMVQDYEECVISHAESNCGDKAGNLIEGLMTKMEGVLAKEYHFDCPFIAADGSSEDYMVEEDVFLPFHKKLMIGLSVGLGVPVIVLVIVVVALICRRRSRSHSLDKKELVKHEVLQTNLQVALSTESDKDTGIKSLSISNLKV